MTYDEALEWLNGQRSWWNTHSGVSTDRNIALAQCAVHDAASTQQAYWIVKAHKEGLLGAVQGLQPEVKGER